jgi:hypothetical protein
MAKRFLPGALSLAIAILSFNFVPPVEAKSRDNLELAAAFQLPELPRLPGLGGASADWRQWDSFFTFIVKRVGQDASGERLVGRSISRLALRIDRYRDASRQRAESGARAFFERLATVVAGYEQNAPGSAAAIRRTLSKFHRRD